MVGYISLDIDGKCTSFFLDNYFVEEDKLRLVVIFSNFDEKLKLTFIKLKDFEIRNIHLYDNVKTTSNDYYHMFVEDVVSKDNNLIVYFTNKSVDYYLE